MHAGLKRLRELAIARSLFPETTLARAIDKQGFVQADPIRAPARAEDLTLRHRVKNYREGDLLRRYAALGLEESHFVNYGFLPQKNALLLHPRGAFRAFDRTAKKRAAEILAFVVEKKEAHPREVDARFDHGTVTNYWGGSSSATTYLLNRMHDNGLLRIVRRESGIRIYAPRDLSFPPPSSSSPSPPPSSSIDRARALLAIAINLYAPLPASTLVRLARMIRRVVPSIAKEVTRALADVRKNFPSVHVDGVDFYLPEGERFDTKLRDANADRVRFLAPFDPVVWDRDRFEIFWGWQYRFEAYTPIAKRKLGYYALPVLWRGHVIGWANTTTRSAVSEERQTRGELSIQLGYVKGNAPKDRAFARELDAEVERLRTFLKSRA